MNEGFEAKSKARLIFKSACHSATGRSYNREHVIDFSELRGIQRLGEPPLLKITRLMERMENHVARVVNASSSLKVNVYDSEDRELERKRWEEEREKLASPSKAE